jgi:hypothetical protein
MGTARAQESPTCSLSVNVIEKSTERGYGIYIEGVAVDCKTKEDTYRAIAAGIQAFQKATTLKQNPLKSQCYDLPDWKPVECGSTAAFGPAPK